MSQFRLANHPDGNARPPSYGFRLDELYNATPNHDIFSFDFDHPSSAMFMDLDIDAGTLRLHGQARGGRDAGADFAQDQYLGLYTIDMLYTIGVSIVPGDDDIWVTADSMTAWGSIITPSSDAIPLTNLNMGGYSLRIGDEDNDLGHRGFVGSSGWGWVNHGSDPSQHVESSDWLFTASPVPTPGAAAIAALGLGLCSPRRRRH
ncbi:MAG: hypothetical protein AB7G11_06400 [Phycisphaerales bacterium]